MIINPEVISEERIKELCLTRFQTDWKLLNCEVTRHLSNDRSDSYEQFLPQFDGLNYENVLGGIVRRGVEPFRVLDIGCGAGVALGEISRLFPEVECYGLSARDYRDRIPMFRELSSQVNFQIGDAQRIDELYPPDFFDSIISVQTFDYLADPLGTIEKAHHLLKPEGIMQVYGYVFPLSELEQARFTEFLCSQGVLPFFRKKELSRPTNHYYDFAWQRKGSNRLDLPFLYLPPEYEGDERLEYKLVL